MRSVIFEGKISFETLQILISAEFIAIRYQKNRRVVYKNRNSTVTLKPNDLIVECENCMDTAVTDVRIAVNNPNNEFDCVQLEWDRQVMNGKMSENFEEFSWRFRRILTSLPFQLHVKRLSIQTNNLSLFQRLLNRTKPKILEEIKLFNVDFPISRDLKTVKFNEEATDPESRKLEWNNVEKEDDLEIQMKIIEMAQFKMARSIRWHHRPILVPLESFFGFEEFEVSGIEEITVEQMGRIKEYIFNEKPEIQLRSAIIYRLSKMNLDEAPKTLSFYQRKGEVCPYTWYTKIPGSKDQVIFYIGEQSVFIRRASPGKAVVKKMIINKRRR